MNVNEIQTNKKVPLIKVKIKELNPVEEKGQHQYQDGIVEDETGTIKIAFWNEQVNNFKAGDEIVIQDGWCKEYEGEKILSGGKFGNIKLVQK